MNAHWRTPAGLHTTSARLPDEGELPSLDGATGWLNSPPLTPAGLRRKPVVVGFWTYTCINWLRQLPYLRAWAGKYSGHGLVVIGVHTPEFSFEHNVGNVRQAVQDMRITYPVALDNDYAVWRAFGNHYWPRPLGPVATCAWLIGAVQVAAWPCGWSTLTGGRSRTCCLVRLTSMRSSALVTALMGMATSRWPHR
jgi:thiol-disulfide isomerase/thioredoxin